MKTPECEAAYTTNKVSHTYDIEICQKQVYHTLSQFLGKNIYWNIITHIAVYYSVIISDLINPH